MKELLKIAGKSFVSASIKYVAGVEPPKNPEEFTATVVSKIAAKKTAEVFFKDKNAAVTDDE
ncbi:MAG: hypothetical protein MUC28_03780 [Planctomycetes bacterium]|nr:hypothetical protein [Planctomycetota bacterium]